MNKFIEKSFNCCFSPDVFMNGEDMLIDTCFNSFFFPDDCIYRICIGPQGVFNTKLNKYSKGGINGLFLMDIPGDLGNRFDYDADQVLGFYDKSIRPNFVNGLCKCIDMIVDNFNEDLFTKNERERTLEVVK